MENIGIKLKQARTNQGKTLEEIHRHTRIATEHLRLLEEDRFDFLPETYVKSFLKDYARELGLDAEKILGIYQANQDEERRRRKEQEAAEQELRVQPAVPSQILEWALGIGAVMLLIGTVLVYFQYRSLIYAQPSLPYEPTFEAEFAQMGIPEADHSAVTESQMASAEIKAKERVWLLVIEDEKVREFTLSANESLSWASQKEKFDILVGNAAVISVTSKGKTFEPASMYGEKMLFTITADGQVMQKRIADHRDPSSYSSN